uniref:Uncharacterized protein n=1 Tax=Cacopsylla melanoneura TaxID=428564 RepID=A0A8D9AXT3_9HEMI
MYSVSKQTYRREIIFIPHIQHHLHLFSSRRYRSGGGKSIASPSQTFVRENSTSLGEQNLSVHLFLFGGKLFQTCKKNNSLFFVINNISFFIVCKISLLLLLHSQIKLD